MLKENWRLIARLERLGDFCIVVGAFFVAYYGRSSLVYWNEVFKFGLPFEGSELAPIKDYFVALVVALVGYAGVLHAMGSYSSMRLSSVWRLLSIAVVSSALVFLLLSSSLYLLKVDLSRAFLALFCILVTLSLTAERYFVLYVLRFYRRRGRNFRNLIICGVGEQAVRFAREVSRRPELGIVVRGFADLTGSLRAPQRTQLRSMLRQAGFMQPVRLISGADAVERALKEYSIDEVIFADVLEVMPVVERIILLCAEQGVRTTLMADLFSIGMVKSGLSYFGGLPLIHFQTPPGDRWELAVKRAFDVAFAAIALVVLAPFGAIIALAIRIDSPGVVLYRQRRVGLNGRIFTMYKFRSMGEGSEQQLEELRAQNEMQGPAFKLKSDPRVTRVGRFLRRFSLDELPQLWNVLIGDMSLVGPRPPIPGEVSLYERRDRRRLSMRPGMTCTWQVSGRNEISDFDSWVKLDLEYIDNWSLARDMFLLWRTIPAVIFGSGAR
jgi:exopolysaccharide biosynthesis polyprenyl glycosylphosphotransferase